MSANIDVVMIYSLERAEQAGYTPIGEPARYLVNTSKFDLKESEEDIIRLSETSFTRIDYDTILLLKDCGLENKCIGDGFWVQPAKKADAEELYQLTRGYAIAPHETPGNSY